MMTRPYAIWTPKYSHVFAGIRALHQLKKELNDRGIESYFYNEKHNPQEIMIYPEIIRDNPQNSKRVVRWLLNKATFRKDLCYAWEIGIGNYPLLTTNIVEMDLWVPSKKTNKVAYWVGKGEFNSNLIPKNAVEISKEKFPKRKQLAKFISSLDYLISFDTFSAVNLESVVCGTPVLIYNSSKVWNPSRQHKDSIHTWSKKEFKKHNWMPYGIAWDYSELEKAKEEVYLARPHYESLLPVFQERIDNFVIHTQKYFNV